MFPLSTFLSHFKIIKHMMRREFRPNLNDIEYKLWLQNYDWFIEHNYPIEEAIKNADKFIKDKKINKQL